MGKRFRRARSSLARANACLHTYTDSDYVQLCNTRRNAALKYTLPFELFFFLCETSVCLISRLLSKALQLRVGRHTGTNINECCFVLLCDFSKGNLSKDCANFCIPPSAQTRPLHCRSSIEKGTSTSASRSAVITFPPLSSQSLHISRRRPES